MLKMLSKITETEEQDEFIYDILFEYAQSIFFICLDFLAFWAFLAFFYYKAA